MKNELLVYKLASVTVFRIKGKSIDIVISPIVFGKSVNRNTGATHTHTERERERERETERGRRRKKRRSESGVCVI